MRYWKERKFGERPLVTMQVASFLDGDPRQIQALRCLLASFQAQTYKDWEALVTHDGTLHSRDAMRVVGDLCKEDPRIHFIETPEREGKFGHRWRQWIVNKRGKGAIVGFTNQDNYYCPSYLEWLVHELLVRKAQFVYCDMIHSHRNWTLLKTKPAYKHLDLGGFLARVELVRATPWKDFTFKGDGAYINALVKGAKRVVKVDAALFVHN